MNYNITTGSTITCKLNDEIGIVIAISDTPIMYTVLWQSTGRKGFYNGFSLYKIIQGKRLPFYQSNADIEQNYKITEWHNK